MSAAAPEDDGLWYSQTKGRNVRLSEMHGAHLLNAARQLLREAFDERKACAEAPAVPSSGRDPASILTLREAAARDDLWTWTVVQSLYREDFGKLLGELRRRADGRIEGSIRSYAIHLDVRGYPAT